MEEQTGMDLRLFDGGAAADGGGTSGDTGPGAADAGHSTTGEGTASAADAGRKGKRDGQRVVYGKQGDAPGGQDEPKTDPKEAPDRKKDFQDLVTGEYREEFNARVSEIVQGRLQKLHQAQQVLAERVEKAQPLLDMLRQRYNIPDADPARLMEAIQGDDAYWAQVAEAAGMTVDQYRKFQRLQLENQTLWRQRESLQEAQRRRWSEEKAQEQLRQWYRDADEVRADYPAFDMGRELQDPRFVSMLKSRVPIRQAYEVLHMDDIKSAVAQQTAQRTEKQVVDDIRAKGTRPQENGTAAQSGFVVKDDVSKLTRKDRAEIARRAAMGEVIRF